MSAHDHDHQHGHDHGHDGHDDHHGQGGHPESTFGGYMVGFVLSVLLTAIPFWLVMHKVFARSDITAFVILGIGAVQIIVHMVYFLHMTPKAEGGWSMLALLFTGVLLVILLSGSIWVMYHLNTNMMPAHDMTDMRNMP